MPTEPVAGENAALTLEQLAASSDVNVRTIRYYIAEGLLPSPGARGKQATYTQDHLHRLNLIRLLTEQRIPLTQIRDRLAVLSLEDVRSLLMEETRHSVTLKRAAASPSPKAYINSLLERSRTYRTSPRTAAAPLSAAPSAPPFPSMAAPPEASPAPSSSMAAEPETPSAPSASLAAAPETSPALHEPTNATTWRRITLAPGLELHVSTSAESRYAGLIRTLQARAASQNE